MAENNTVERVIDMKTLEEACQSLTKALVEMMAIIADSPGSTPKLYTVDELAKKFGKSKSTISRWITDGDFGDCVHAGSSWLVPESGVELYLEQNTTQAVKKVYGKTQRAIPRGSAERI